MIFFIVVLFSICIMYIFRKNIVKFIKYIIKNKKILALLIIIFIISLTIYLIINYQKENPHEVDKNICNMVENYLYKNYYMEGNIKASWYTHNIEGFTGGLYMYTFKFRNKSGKIIYINYDSYADLTEETIDDLKLREK